MPKTHILQGAQNLTTHVYLHISSPTLIAFLYSSLQCEALPLMPQPHIYIGFFGHYSWVVQHSTHLCPIIVQGIVMETYYTPFLQSHTRSTVNWLMQTSKVRGKSWMGISRHHYKASLNSSLDRSILSSELGKIVI